ncbi:SOS response-associated peptidase [Comamonadaceae bacterium G21597-S1]|nr:SOS response-associated peptidase [Comamonadaceae bacterium G21597-S1]
MCSHYQAIKERERFFRLFGVYPPDADGKFDMWPGYTGVMVRRPREAEAGDDAVPAVEAVAGLFGLLPHWARDAKLARNTFNARSETVHEKPSFRDAWRRNQHCIIPAEAIFEPDWRTGKAVATRIARADGEPMGIAGLWSWWRSPEGQTVWSFTMLTINADEHALMRNMHRPNEEKRMVVILPRAAHDDWLDAPAHQSMALLRPYPADKLVATTT